MAQINIRSRTARAALKARAEPYWTRIAAGQYLGYRAGPGTWIARFRAEDGKQHYRALGAFSDYDAAVAAARQHFSHVERTAEPTVLTVADVCRAYVASLRGYERHSTAADAEGRFRRLVFDAPIGRIPLDRLRASTVEQWLHGQSTGTKASMDSANRNLRSLKAALNHAYERQLVASRQAWESVSAFSDTASRRADALLTRSDCERLLGAASPDLKLFIRAALLTGARPGELANLTVADFNRQHGTLRLNGKTGDRGAPLSAAACAFFTALSRDKLPGAHLLTNGGRKWIACEWSQAMIDAREAAGLPPTVVAYALRHTAISNMLAGGLSLFEVATLTGTSVMMIEKHYGHLTKGSVKAKLDSMEALA